MLGGVIWVLLFAVASCQEGAAPNSEQVEQIVQQPPTLQHDYANFNMGEDSDPEVEADSAGARLKSGTLHNEDNDYTQSSVFQFFANFLPSLSHFVYGGKTEETDLLDSLQGDEPIRYLPKSNTENLLIIFFCQ